jgi:two-component system sensor histidine kinase UhpB
MARVESMVDEVDRSLDFLAWKLRPEPPPDIGLVAAIDSYLKQWSSYADVAAELMAPGLKDARFNAEIESNLYCIVQEALDNTQKHATADNVLVTLQRKNGSVMLIVADDGKGFALRNKAKNPKGLGLIGMRERAALIGGTLEIETARKAGTTIYVSIPVKGP